MGHLHSAARGGSRDAPRLRYEWLVALAVVALAAVLRFWDLGGRPGYEWDETVYTDIARHFAETGVLAVKPYTGTYLFHPPFYFLLLGAWFKAVGAGITQARVLAATMSLLALGLTYAFMRRFLGAAALLPLTLLATDGWLIYTNRVSWMENTLIVLGVGAIWLYVRAVESAGDSTRYLLAGLALGICAIFKHLGLYFTVAVLINWIIIRKDARQHLLLLSTVVAVVAVYLGTMTLLFRGALWSAYGVQLGRTLGTHEARGTVSGAGAAIRPILAQYHIFYGTIVLVVVGVVMVMVKLVRVIRARSFAAARRHSVLTAWTVAALISFGTINLRFPHYYIMILVPMYLMITQEGIDWFRQGSVIPHARLAGAVAVAALLCANGATFAQRFGERHDNALLAVAHYMRHVPVADTVITEQTVGDIIRQPYCEMWRTASCVSEASYVIVYRSHTQHPPDILPLMRLIAAATRLRTFVGFKERLTVYRITPSSRAVALAALHGAGLSFSRRAPGAYAVPSPRTPRPAARRVEKHKPRITAGHLVKHAPGRERRVAEPKAGDLDENEAGDP
ncbi:MAG: glycosyltransferase family 39 protein [Actinobacteria bacterium]|nr:glycosyltransferase family 39 protein [Actinomycetota bacterium]